MNWVNRYDTSLFLTKSLSCKGNLSNQGTQHSYVLARVDPKYLRYNNTQLKDAIPCKGDPRENSKDSPSEGADLYKEQKPTESHAVDAQKNDKGREDMKYRSHWTIICEM